MSIGPHSSTTSHSFPSHGDSLVEQYSLIHGIGYLTCLWAHVTSTSLAVDILPLPGEFGSWLPDSVLDTGKGAEAFQ